MKSIILALSLLFTFCFVQAESFQYTVIAENGLSVRTKPSIESEKITTVPFGELVWSENPGVYDKLDTISGTIGFWLKIKYEGTTGYMFSGFLISGDIFPLSRVDTLPYIVMDEWAEYSESGKFSPGFYNHLRYSPNMYWYGVKIIDTTTIITKTNIIPEYNSNRWDKSDNKIFDVKLKVDQQENFDFVFGSKYEFVPREIKSKKYYGLDSKIGLFIYPEQIQRIDPVTMGYTLCGSETISCSKNTVNMIDRTYAMNLLHWEDTILIRNIDKFFNLQEPARKHAIYKNPQLFWSGDLNNDGHPDLVLKHGPMKDSCGSIPFLYFLISQEQNGKVEYYATSTGIDIQKIR